MLFNKYKRTNFLTKSTVNDIEEYDLLLSHWDLFEINNDVTFGNIKYTDLNRPDRLALRIYGDSRYWWILCKINNIDDVWNDMELGQRIIIPSIDDITSFVNRVNLNSGRR